MTTGATTLDPRLAERERIVARLREAAPRLRALGVERLWLFGSIARGEVGPKSDVDVLISVPPAQKFSLLDLAEVRVDLCEILGREVDVVVREDARPQLWETIRDDLIEVF